MCVFEHYAVRLYAVYGFDFLKFSFEPYLIYAVLKLHQTESVFLCSLCGFMTHAVINCMGLKFYAVISLRWH